LLLRDDDGSELPVSPLVVKALGNKYTLVLMCWDVLVLKQVPFQIALELAAQLMRRKVFSSTSDKIGIRLFGVNKFEGKECEEKVSQFS